MKHPITGLLVLAASASAQSSTGPAQIPTPPAETSTQSARADRDVESDARVLEERSREALHPAGDPLDLVGREERDNGFRARVPVLAAAEARIAFVDEEATYRRRRAMYEEGAVFTAPPRRAERTASASAPAGWTSRSTAQGVNRAKADTGAWGTGLWTAGLIVVVVGLWLRRQSSRAASRSAGMRSS